jgi:hypothetical protein
MKFNPTLDEDSQEIDGQQVVIKFIRLDIEEQTD